MSLLMTFIAQLKLASHYTITTPILIHRRIDRENVTLPIPIPNEERKLTFIFTLVVLPQKVSHLFVLPQRLKVSFYINATFWMHAVGKVNRESL